jgi:hypothetical protein
MSEDNKIILPGSETYWSGYEFGETLDKQFPDQDAIDFATAIAYAAPRPAELQDKPVIALKMIQQGENDGRNWLWAVQFEGAYDGDWWVLCAGCDYTGWDCQAGGHWTKVSG